MVERDISIAELTGGRVHVAHMSARQSLRAVREGKARGVRVTAEVTPHHFVLTDAAIAERGGYDTNFKMNPPLREPADRDAMLEGLARRVRRRHRHRSRAAPRATRRRSSSTARRSGSSDSRRPCPSASIGWCIPGVLTIEPLRRVAVGESRARHATCPAAPWSKAVPPTSRFSLPTSTSPSAPRRFRSKSRNTPFDGWTLKGAVAATIVGGRAVYVNEPVLGRRTLIGP